MPRDYTDAEFHEAMENLDPELQDRIAANTCTADLELAFGGGDSMADVLDSAEALDEVLQQAIDNGSLAMGSPGRYGFVGFEPDEPDEDE